MHAAYKPEIDALLNGLLVISLEVVSLANI
jgi:hypothetical protein